MVACPRCRTRYPDGTSACAIEGEALVADDQVPPPDSDLPPGTTVGEYRIEGKLGEGGFGAVYKAVHPVIGKAAAIKVLGFDFSSNPEMVSRFVAEARAVNQIRHKNIIDVFSFGRLPDGRQYYVMELLSGTTLDAYFKERGCLSIEETLPVLRGIARALGAAHAGGIAHRDLKPENVFLVFDEDGGVMPKLIDFGIAKLLGDDGAAGHKTRTGTPMGTPYYMSPEQCRGKNVDHRTDIYSLGILTYVLLTGKRPFTGESMMDILLKHITEPAPKLSEALPGAPKELDDAVAALLEKDPARRPQSAAEALSRIEGAVKGLSPEARSTRAGKGARGADGDRVSLGAGMSAAEAETAHTVATGPSAAPNTPSDTIQNGGPPSGMQQGTLEPASRDTGAATTPGVPSAMPKRRSWVPLGVGAAALLGAGLAIALVTSGGKPPASGAASGATSGQRAGAASAETASSTAAAPSVVPAGEASGAAPEKPAATATATATATAKSPAAATATAKSPATATATGAKSTAGTGATGAPKTTAASTGKPKSPKGDANDLSY